jgi:hypothetical protein
MMAKHGRLAPNECLLGTRNREIARNPRNRLSPSSLHTTFPGNVQGHCSECLAARLGP